MSEGLPLRLQRDLFPFPLHLLLTRVIPILPRRSSMSHLSPELLPNLPIHSTLLSMLLFRTLRSVLTPRHRDLHQPPHLFLDRLGQRVPRLLVNHTVGVLQDVYCSCSVLSLSYYSSCEGVSLLIQPSTRLLQVDRLRRQHRLMLVLQQLPDKTSIDRQRLALPSSAMHSVLQITMDGLITKIRQATALSWMGPITLAPRSGTLVIATLQRPTLQILRIR